MKSETRDKAKFTIFATFVATSVALVASSYTYLNASKDQRFAIDHRYERLAKENAYLRNELIAVQAKIEKIEQIAQQDATYYKLVEQNLKSQGELLIELLQEVQSK